MTLATVRRSDGSTIAVRVDGDTAVERGYADPASPPGDVIITGTPGGVGDAREPREFLAPGQVVGVAIGGVGELANALAAEKRSTNASNS